jgi:HlyD family secretion protein
MPRLPTSPWARRALWLVAALLILATVLGVRAWRGTEVETAVAERGPIRQTVVATGRIAAPATIELAAQATARVGRVLVREADRVGEGQPLIELDADEARAQLAQARAAQVEAEARMVQLARVGAPVAGEQLRQAEATLAQARSEFERVKALTDKGFFSSSRLDEAERALKSAEAGAAAARAQAEAQRVGGAEHALAQARLEQARAALALAQARLANLVIKAPVAGQITLREVEPGDVAQAGRRLLAMVAAGETRIHAQVDEKNLRHLAPGQQASAVADAFPGQTFPAELYYVAPAVDATRGTVEIRLRVPQPPAFLRPDMTASVEMLAARKDAAVILPAEFVRDLDGSPWVLAVREGRALRVPVALGVRGVGQVEVAQGLAEGERVIVATSPVAEGARVRAVDRRPPKARAGVDVPAMTGR